MTTASSKKISLENPLPTLSPHVQRFLARQLLLDRDVEFRMLPTGASPALRQVFLLELEDLMNLDAPEFLPVLDHGVTKGQPFYLVPRRDATPLWEQLKAPETTRAERCRMARGLAKAYASAHAAGLLLGPLSPLTLHWDSETRVMHLLHHRVPNEVRPLPYPEEAPRAERRPEGWSPAGDVLHWAYFAYWLITEGAIPFAGPGAAKPIRDVVPTVQRELAHAIDGSLVRDAALRPENALELVEVLARVERDLVPEDELIEASGILAHESLGASIEKLRSAGHLRPPPAAPERRPLELGDASEVEVSGLVLDAQGRRGLLALGGVVLVVGLVGGVMLGGLRRGLEPTRVEARTPAIKRQPPPPPLEVAPLAPSDQARFRDRAGMRQLLDQGAIHPARFPSVWRRVHLLALKGALPPQLLEEDRLLGIRAAYRDEQAQGCRQLEALLADLREALGEAGEGGAEGDP